MSPRNSSFISNISIHAAREGGDQIYTLVFCFRQISIHAAREGGDACGVKQLGLYTQFQSTPPVKAATRRKSMFENKTFISIHAAREGGDFAVTN